MTTIIEIPQISVILDESNTHAQHNRNSTENSTAYENLSLVKKLSNNKFPINLVFSQATQQYYVMKIFPCFGRHLHPNYTNELRFTSLKHPNVVNYVHHENSYQQENGKRASYTLMEYAPHGDFFNLISNYGNKMDDKLIRNFFRQMIEGIEYLHRNGIIHLDLKPDNLLLGSDFTLKITDFDLSSKQEDNKIVSNGTKYSRAPELFRPRSSSSSVKASFAADIYSAGIILFILKSGGIYPHTEDVLYKGMNLIDMMYNDNDKFWEKHCKMGRKESSFYEESFKTLFNQMVKENPSERLTISQIKESEWYNGPVYSSGELSAKMKELLDG